MLHLFGDESADETKQRVYALSGLLGTEWKLAEEAWLARTGGKVFHATEGVGRPRAALPATRQRSPWLPRSSDSAPKSLRSSGAAIWARPKLAEAQAIAWVGLES